MPGVLEEKDWAKHQCFAEPKLTRRSQPPKPGNVSPGPLSAVLAGAGVGVLGGLLGLGGAEFRLPVLVAMFAFPLRRAIPLNLAVSFVAVVVAAPSRWWLAGQAPPLDAAPVAMAMIAGGMSGAGVGARWLARVSDARLHAAVRALLIGIGGLLIAEAVTPWASRGLPLGAVGQAVAASLAGLGIGAVSTLLGVAGGELIIPTLVLAFGVPIKAAGTLSLLISMPTMLVGLTRHRALGGFRWSGDAERVVIPMALGTVVGSAAGALLVVFIPSIVVKVLLGCVLIGSALRVFRANGSAHHRERRSQRRTATPAQTASTTPNGQAPWRKP